MFSTKPPRSYSLFAGGSTATKRMKLKEVEGSEGGGAGLILEDVATNAVSQYFRPLPLYQNYGSCLVPLKGSKDLVIAWVLDGVPR